MKREYVNCLLLSFAFLLLGIVDSTAQKYCKTLVFEYSSERFPITQVGEEQECLIEDITTQSYTYGELGEPYIPYLRYSIVLPDNYKISDFTYSWGNDTCKMDRIFSYPTRESLANNSPDTLVTDSIILYPVPIPIVGSGPILESPDYPLTTYPAKAWHTVRNVMIDNYKIEYFYICPFTYYAAERKLILRESIEVTLTIEPSYGGETSHKGNRDDYIKDIVCNPEDFGKGLEGWTPVPANIVADGKQWNLHHVMPHAVDYVYNIKQWIEGDTLVDGELCQKLYTLTTTEDERISQKETLNVDYCQQVGRKFYKNGELMFDFDLQLNDTFLLVEFLDTTYTMVTHVGDTILNDGVVRRYLKVNEFFPEYSYVKPNSYDIWVEGVGSLSMGIYDNRFTAKGYVTTLQSCTYDDVIIYQKENSSQIVVTNSETRGKNVRFLGQFLHCTAPGAVKLEVYTMDALKVGEAAFVNGEAAIKVGTTPALYLYVVNYPDGHRESRKVLVNEE